MYTKSQKTAISKYRKTKKGIVNSIFHQQKTSSKKRAHPQPVYTKEELREWLYSQDLFHELFSIWENSGFIKSYKPSIDRIDDTKGYSFFNIKLMTWGENNSKGYKCQIDCTKYDGQRAVTKIDIYGNDICSYMSIAEARRVNPRTAKISECCSGKRKTAGGFGWRYAIPS